MTRINSSIKPIELCDQHLRAEIRELPRILNNAKKGKYKSEPPSNFRLGAGHELFFTNKLQYLVDRHKELVVEAKKRGFNIMSYESSYSGLPVELLNNWEETAESRRLLSERINERLNSMKNIHYYSESIKSKYIQLI